MDIAEIKAATQQVAKKDTSAANADRFLTMLVAQLKNQDPLNPLDNAQVTTQMAQISTVEGVNKLNSTLESLAGAFGAAQPLQAASMVGRQVLVQGAALSLDESGARGGFALAGNAERVILTVKDAAGSVLHKAELGKQAGGLHLFEWDGKTDSGVAAAPGTYSFEIKASAGKEDIASEALTLGRVDAVRPTNDGVRLTLGVLGETDLASVRQIF